MENGCVDRHDNITSQDEPSEIIERVDFVVRCELTGLIVLKIDERSAFLERLELLGGDMSPVIFDVSGIAIPTDSDLLSGKIEIERLDVESCRPWVIEQKRRRMIRAKSRSVVCRSHPRSTELDRLRDNA